MNSTIKYKLHYDKLHNCVMPHLKGGICVLKRMFPITDKRIFTQKYPLPHAESIVFKQKWPLPNTETGVFKQKWPLRYAEEPILKQKWPFTYLSKALLLLLFEPFFRHKSFWFVNTISGKINSFFINYPGILPNGITPGSKT